VELGDPAVYAGIGAGEAELYVCEDAALASAIRERELAPDIFLWVSGIDEVYLRRRTGGAEIAEELTTRTWDFPNGQHLWASIPSSTLVD
jgi:hypothetical protein